MCRTLTTLALVLALAGAAFALQQDDRGEIMSRGEIVAVSVEEGILTVEETPEPDAEPSPDAMQSGVRRDFVVDESTKLTSGDETIALTEIQVGSMATVHYVLDSGKNVALAVELRAAATE